MRILLPVLQIRASCNLNKGFQYLQDKGVLAKVKAKEGTLAKK
jgi:hypothetical protein